MVYLHIDVSPIVDKKLQAERSMCRGRGKVQWGESLVVWLADIGTVVDQLTHYSVLTIKTGHMERCVSKRVGFIDLRTGKTILAVMVYKCIIC